MIVNIYNKVLKAVKERRLLFGTTTALSLCLILLPVLLGEVGNLEDGAWLGFLKGSSWAAFLGFFHPLVLHLPIGSLILIFSLELIQLFYKKGAFDMTIPLIFNGLTSVTAAVLGMFWYYCGESFSSSSDLLDSHMWRGLIYAICAIWLPIIYSYCKKSCVGFYRFFLLGSVAMMTIAAHDGGESTHGDPFDKAPWNQVEKNITRVADPQVDTAGGDKTVPEVVDFVIYDEIVTPILSEKCYACHHSSKKVKADLKFDTYADILKGGEYQEDYPTLVPGDVKKSYLIVTIELPEDDDLHMPPPKKPQVTADELALLKWWVAIGAPEKKKLSEVEVPDDIQALLNKG